MPTTTTFGALVTQGSSNVLKGLKGGVLIAPASTTLPTALTAMNTATPPAPALQSLTGFSSLGFLSDAGAVLNQNISTADIQAWGKGDPVRSDITSKVTTLQIVGLESNKTVLSTYFKVDPTTLVPDATTGELQITDTGDLSSIYYRVLVLSQDGATGSETWVATLLPRASVTSLGSMTFMSGATAIEYDMTLTAYPDPVAGFSKKLFYAGPGWLANKTVAGF